MNLGITVSTLILSILIFTLILSSLNVDIRNTLISNDLLQKKVNQILKKLNSKVEINSVIVDSLDSSILYVNLTNSGTTSVHVKEFSNIDIIIVYTNVNNTKIIARLTYEPSGEGINIWYVKRVLTNGRESEILNPMNFTSGQGLWDPNEVLEITMKLMYSLNVSKGFTIVITLPNGVKDVYNS